MALSNEQIAAITTGSVVFAGLIAVLVWYFVFHNKNTAGSILNGNNGMPSNAKDNSVTPESQRQAQGNSLPNDNVHPDPTIQPANDGGKFANLQ